MRTCIDVVKPAYGMQQHERKLTKTKKNKNEKKKKMMNEKNVQEMKIKIVNQKVYSRK